MARFARVGVCVCSLLVSLAGTASAVAPGWVESEDGAGEQPSPARVERGTLRRGDTTLSSGEYYDEYEFRARRGQHIRVRLESADFNAYLIVVDPSDEQTENDDARSGTEDAAVEMEAPRTGRHRVLVTSSTPRERGDYVLTIEVGDAADLAQGGADDRRRDVPGGAGPASEGVVLDEEGSLRRGDEELTSGEYFDRYRFEGREGQHATVRLESDDFNTYVILKDPEGDQEENEDHEGDEGISQIQTTLSASGEYEVLVTTHAPGERGSYRVVVTLEGQAQRPDRPADRPAERPVERPADRPADRPASDRTPRPVDGPELLEVHDGELRRGDETLDSGEYVDEYRFSAEAGQHVVVRMNAEEFDTYLIVQPPEGEQIDNDDYNGSTSVSLVETDATTSGEWVVRATSFEEGQTGDYALTISVSNSDVFYERDEAVAIDPDGGEASGELGRDDLQRFTGEYADVYTFEGEPGRFYVAEVEGDRGMDTYLLLRRENGAPLFNDDFEGELNRSRVQFLVTQPGPVDLIVSTFEGGDTGGYEVRVTSQGGAPEWHHEPSVTPGRIYGVFAGITDYSARNQNDLQYCADDARRAYQNALEFMGMSEGDGVLLQDDDATVEAVEDAIRTLAPRMDYDDVLIVFYSGHGGQTERTAFQATDPDMKDEILVLADDDLSDDALDQLLTTVQRGTVLLVLDSCNSGGFAKDVISRPGRLGLFASAEDCLSVVATEREAGGYLADFFVEAIGPGRGEADTNGDRELTVIEMCQFIAERYRTEVVSDSKPPVTPRTWETVISPTEYRGYQQLLIDRGGIGPHEVLFGW